MWTNSSPRTLQNYDGKAFCNITTDDLDLDTEEEKKAAEEQKKDLEPVLDYLKSSWKAASRRCACHRTWVPTRFALSRRAA